MRDNLPEDELLRPLYEAMVPERVWQRVAASHEARNPWRARFGNPARPLYSRPLARALAVSLVIGAGAIGLHGVGSGRSSGVAGSRFASTTCNPAAGLETPGPAPSPAPGTSPTNPEAGLSDSQREELHKEGSKNFQERYAAWVNSLKVDQIDLHAVPRGGTTGSVVAAQPSLDAAVAKADRIVVGCVAAVRPTAFSGTETTFSVEQTLKGPSTPSLMLNQSGFLFPTPDWKGATILEGGDGALLLPGDRAVLLLQKSNTGDYYIQSISGWYAVVNGIVHPDGLDSWAQTIEGKSEPAFVELIKAAVKQ